MCLLDFGNRETWLRNLHLTGRSIHLLMGESMLLNYYFRFRPNIFLHVTLCTVDLCSCSSNLKLITFSWKLFVSFLLFVPFIRSSMLPFFFFFPCRCLFHGFGSMNSLYLIYTYLSRYYYNKRTKQSNWEKPLELMTPLEVILTQ